MLGQLRYGISKPLAPRDCPKQSLPFAELAAKAKLCRLLERYERVRFATRSAFRVVRAPVVAPRHEDVQCERVLTSPQFFQRRFNLASRLLERIQGVLQASGSHAVQPNI